MKKAANWIRRSGNAPLSRDDLIALLSLVEPEDIDAVRSLAHEILLRERGPEVYYRGLIEFSNHCSRDCLYCGLRRSSRAVKRYSMGLEDLLKAARWCAEQGFGSVVIQTGERSDEPFIAELESGVRRIKGEIRIASLPEGLGITLCVGEQTRETYERLFEAGAHRYLLRIETSNPALFARIHPRAQRLESRLACLRILREVGYQVGTGVMIGLPGQTAADLADDIGFFVREDIDMIGMGPFIPHQDTPLGSVGCPSIEERMRMSLLMIAAARIAMPDINIAATTALEALDSDGRIKGLTFGANVVMPLLTPDEVRRDYLIYPGKPFLDETVEAVRAKFEERVVAMGRRIGHDQWGDSAHALNRGRG